MLYINESPINYTAIIHSNHTLAIILTNTNSINSTLKLMALSSWQILVTDTANITIKLTRFHGNVFSIHCVVD